MGEPSTPGADTTALMLGALAGAAVVAAAVIVARRVCGQRLHACMRPLCPQFADAFIKYFTHCAGNMLSRLAPLLFCPQFR